jgi:hypothetical protein
MKVVRLENEIVIFGIVFGIVHRKPYQNFQKYPYMSSLKKFVTEIENFEIFF